MRIRRIFKANDESRNVSLRFRNIVVIIVIMVIGIIGITWVHNAPDFGQKRDSHLLPKSETETGKRFSHETTTVRISSSGEMSVGETPTSFLQLSILLSKTVKEVSIDTPIVLKADSDTTWETLQPIIQTIGTNGFYRVAFGVRCRDDLPGISPVVVIPNISPLEIKEGASFITVRLNEANSRSNLTYMTSILTKVKMSGSDNASVAIWCMADMKIQTLIKMLDVIENAECQGMHVNASLILKEELMRNLEAHNLQQSLR